MILSNFSTRIRALSLPQTAYVAVAFSLALGANSLFSAAAQPQSPQKLFQEGVEAQQRGDDLAAIRKYRELLTAHPEAVNVRVNLGATLAHLKRFS